MNAFQSTTRQPRGRALIVGQRASMPSGQAMPDRTIAAADLYDAIGHIASASAREPIQFVLIAIELLSHDTVEAVAAMRRVDPAVQIYGLSDNGEPVTVNDTVRAQLDDVIHGSFNLELIDELFEARSTEKPRDAAPQFEAPTSAATPQAAPQPMPRRSDAGHEPARSEPLSGTPVDEPAAAAPQPHASQPHSTETGSPQPLSPEPTRTDGVEHAAGARSEEHESASPAGEPDVLGDIDLVEAIMHQPGSLRDLAIQLMKQQTGWSDVHFDTDPPSDPPDLCVEVVYQNKRFGALCSNTAEPKQLAMWAHWLATWLALDESQRQLRTMAYRDHLTGAWSRRFYDAYVAQIIEQARRRREPVTIMVFDIDDFKQFNDRFGHDAGDEILIETVRLLNSVIREDDRVCRIGGDEFAVIFWDPHGPREPGSQPLESVESIAKRFQEQVCQMRFPKLGPEAPGTLSISAGLSTYPWDGNDPEALLKHADQLALESKRKGKNVLTFGPGTQRICTDD